MRALYQTFPQSVGMRAGVPSHHIASLVLKQTIRSTSTLITRATPTKTTECEREHEIPTRQATPERGSVLPLAPSHHRSPTSPASGRTGSSTFSYPTAPPSPLSKRRSRGRNSSGGARMRWNSAGSNGGGAVTVVLGEAASEACPGWMLRRCIMSSYSATELRAFHCECMRKMWLSELDLSMFIGLLCKTNFISLNYLDQICGQAKRMGYVPNVTVQSNGRRRHLSSQSGRKIWPALRNVRTRFSGPNTSHQMMHKIQIRKTKEAGSRRH